MFNEEGKADAVAEQTLALSDLGQIQKQISPMALKDQASQTYEGFFPQKTLEQANQDK